MRLAGSLLFAATVALGIGCSTSQEASGSGDGGAGGGGVGGGDVGTGYGGGDEAGGSGGGTTTGTTTGTVTGTPTDSGSGNVGLLTAGDWDDNLNFSLFQDFRTHHDQAAGAIVVDYPTQDRITVRVTDEQGVPLPNARVIVSSGATTYLDARASADGRVLFFPGHDGAAGAQSLSVKVLPPPGQAGVTPLVVQNPSGQDPSLWELALPGATGQAVQGLDLLFVIDATASMSDEISYLKAEVAGIVAQTAADFPGVSLRLALIVYRDVGDDYVTKSFDFTGSLDTFQTKLGAQDADGGGDFPEAMEQAMSLVPQLAWSTGNVARMAILIADAPPHPENAQALVDVNDDLRAQGIHLYPLAASGADPEAEHLMRIGAEATLGRYMFLTNDSGIGGDHQEPVIPCYVVQKLKDLLAYEIASELAGARGPVDAANVVKSVGDPADGVCTLADGTTARVW